MTRRFAPLAIWGVLLLTPATALAHGETATTDPEAGGTLRRAPKFVSVALTEPPSRGAKFVVTDACGEVVSGNPQIDGEVLGAEVSGGVSGKWKAEYNAISSVDGHLTKDSWSFKVAGKKDCSPDEPKEDESEQTKRGGGDAAAPGDGDEGGSFPVLPVALGTGGLVALALVIRTRSAT